MRILVTGGLGLIGHNVVARLQAHGHRVIVLDSKTTYGVVPQSEIDYLMSERSKKITANTNIYTQDICDADAVESVFDIERPDVVVHMASFPRQKVVNANPAWGSRVMMEGLLNICESAKRHGVRRMVYISSSMVYGDFADQVTEDHPCRPIGQYGIMKLTGEDIVKDYRRRGAFDYVVVRPSAVYGPLDVEDRVVAKFMLAAMRGGILTVNGPGETLDFTYVDDAADGVVAAATKDTAANNTYNITRSQSVTLLAAAEMIVNCAGQGKISVQDRDLNFPSRGALNIDRARTVLGYDPTINVEQGFQKYYEWISNSVYWSKNSV
jgi:nucleoside-diphosphate-sugar epimerase